MRNELVIESRHKSATAAFLGELDRVDIFFLLGLAVERFAVAREQGQAA